jgi:hypothetical protein
MSNGKLNVQISGESFMSSVRQTNSSFLRKVRLVAQRLIVRPKAGMDSRRMMRAGGMKVSL